MKKNEQIGKVVEPFIDIEIDLLNVLFDERFYEKQMFGDLYLVYINHTPCRVKWEGNRVTIKPFYDYSIDRIFKTIETRKDNISDKLAVIQSADNDIITLKLWQK